MRNFIISQIILLTIVFLSSALADLHDFGGHADEFKGDGDKVPPECQLDLPSGTTKAFYVKWNCKDDTAPDHEIRTELWMQRNGADHPEKIGDFLGFPAAVAIDEKVLNSTSVAAGLPAAFRLVARDRFGVSSISSFFTVYPKESEITKCDLTLTRAATESTEESTGSPETTLILTNAEVTLTAENSSNFTIASKTKVADPCDIAAICDETDDGEAAFKVSINSSSSTVNVTPGNFQASLTGNSTTDSLSMTGTGVIDGVDTEVELSCSN